jgi:PAS domain S-box-containing protein
MANLGHIRATACYKVVIALLMGVIGFGINFKAIHFDFPPFQAGLLPGLAFPLMVSLAWGWPYGLLSATLGMGCQTQWFLRPPHMGWEPFVTIPLMTLWVPWHGWCADMRKKGRFPALNPYWAEIPFRIFHWTVLFVALHWTLHAHPPVWAKEENHLAFICFVGVEKTLNAYFSIMLADVVLNLGPARKIFGLRRRPGQITTGYVISGAVLFGLLFWVIDGLVDYYKFREHLRFLIFKSPESVMDSIILKVSSPDLFARTAFVFTCLAGGLLVSRLLRRQVEDEAALRQSEIRYRRLHETMRDAFVQLDMTGRIVDFNHAYQEMSGYAGETLLGMRELDLVPSTWHAAEKDIINAQVIPKGRSEVYEKEYIRADGSIFPVELRTFLISDDEQRPMGMWSIVRDITQRKEMEREREQAMIALTQSNEDLKQFAYVASHDLQEPLRMVASYTQLLAERYGDKLDEKAHKFIAYAVDGASRMQALILDLLAFSRVETRAQPFKCIDAQNALGAAIVNLKAVLDESGSLVTTDDLPRVRADESQLTMVFQNLISNGIKFQEKQHPPHVHVSAQAQNGAWCFSVRDNGIGIDTKYRDKVFLVFQRLHTRNEYPGTGIGLALCKRIVDRHGGQIWFESSSGQGTTFYFTIPDQEKKEIADG